jgi:hypothetical protein
MMTRDEILSIQSTWGQGIVHIGAAPSWEVARERAQAMIEALYVLDGSLLFAPTRASLKQFRPDLEGALSYFVGRNENYPEDAGFALEPWTSVRFENAGMVLKKDLSIAMGNYFFTNQDGAETKVEYTFGYIRSADGALRIQAHHSALPYVAS